MKVIVALYEDTVAVLGFESDTGHEWGRVPALHGHALARPLSSFPIIDACRAPAGFIELYCYYNAKYRVPQPAEEPNRLLGAV